MVPTCEPIWYGPTRNPWSTTHSTSGSSGGSAVGPAQHDQAGALEPKDQLTGDGRNISCEEARALGKWDARLLDDEVLQQVRNPSQAPRRPASRAGQRRLVRGEDHGVEGRVQCLDPRDSSLDQLGGADHPLPHQVSLGNSVK
jgi:Amidase